MTPRVGSFGVNGLAAAIENFDEVALIAPPGTGKTTILVRLAEIFLHGQAIIPFVVPLSEWSSRGGGHFLSSLVGRRALREATLQQLELLAQHGQLLLMLDGWNELDDHSRKEARTEVKELNRDFPDIRFVISSRQTQDELPISGPLARIDPLTDAQQSEISKALRGGDGLSLLEHAWRTPGLRELVAIPLYLSVLLKHASGKTLPSTKEELLRAFVTQLEKDSDKAELLRQELDNLHTEYLAALAAEGIEQEATSLSDDRARAVVNQEQKELEARGKIAKLLSPSKILDVLSAAHLLNRSSEDAGSVSFQHQQFQEWYASLYVERLMLAAVSDRSALTALRGNVLDLPFWEESILFATERLSRGDQDGANAVAATVIEALGIDPVLAAEMIFRAAEPIWQRTKTEVIEFAARWHKKGRVGRAVDFMISTGRAEFSDQIWPLDQIRKAAST